MLQLQSLYIEEFKNLRDITLDFTDKKGITVLIGNNGSGKSNFLEAISEIFATLYNKKNADFFYTLIYIIDDKKIEVKYTKNKRRTYKFYLDDSPISIEKLQEYLPSKVIALYSGEEYRLWTNYYENFYNSFVKTFKSNQEYNELKLFYLDGAYWNEALLTLLYSKLDDNKKFIENTLKIKKIDEITIKFNKSVIKKYNDILIKPFLDKLNPNNDELIKVDIEKISEELQDYEKDFFNKLIVASSLELIEKISIEFNDGLETEDLSEGEKKQLLLKIAFDILADEKSIVLLDEPDSSIHVSNKNNIKSILCEYENRNTILTTHSPTLMNLFEKELIYLEDGKISTQSEKAKILKEITGGSMSITEQQIVLNSHKDILLVEGKFDIFFIEEAIKKLDEEKYNSLKNINFIPTGGASGLRLFIDKFTPYNNQNIIAILDYDKAGKNEIKELLNEEEEKQLKKDNFIKLESLKNTFLIYLPKPDDVNNIQYEIEDYFPTEKLNEISKKQIDTFKVLKDFKLDKNFVKKELIKNCNNYKRSDFLQFKKLFDLIISFREKTISNKIVPKRKDLKIINNGAMTHKYLESLKTFGDYVTVSEWAEKVGILYPDILEKANEEAKKQKNDTTGLREIAARISSRLSTGGFDGFVKIDDSKRPRRVKYMFKNK